MFRTTCPLHLALLLTLAANLQAESPPALDLTSLLQNPPGALAGADSAITRPRGISGFNPAFAAAGSTVYHPVLKEWARQYLESSGNGEGLKLFEGSGGTLLTIIPPSRKVDASTQADSTRDAAAIAQPKTPSSLGGRTVLGHAEAMVTEELWTLLVGAGGTPAPEAAAANGAPLPSYPSAAEQSRSSVAVRMAVDASRELLLSYEKVTVNGTGLHHSLPGGLALYGTRREIGAALDADRPTAQETPKSRTFYRLSATLVRTRSVPESESLPPEVVVTADRIVTPWTAVSASAEVLTRDALGQRAVRTLPEALGETAGAAVQKTSYGQGSPYLRGFTGFRTLLLVDGIRLNHPAFREGANQYWNTVDSGSLERLEILKGAGSVLYGSDAVGGTVQAFTRSPVYATEGESLATGWLFTRLSSAERSLTTRAEGMLAEGRLALLAGVGAKTFGDLEAGNSVGRQRRTGYDELDLDVKLRLALDANRELIVAYQRVAQDDVWRTHRTPHGISWHGTNVGKEQRHVFDQERQLATVRYLDTASTRLYDRLTATLYGQRQSEDKDVVKQDGAHTTDGFDVNTLGLTLELEKKTDLGLLIYGAEWIHDRVDSYRVSYQGNGTKSWAIQGPVGDDATVDTLAVFAEHRTPFGERWTLTPGGRVTWVRADVGRYEDFTQTPHAPASLTRDWMDFTGGLKLARRMLDDEAWTLYGSVAQSFRAPNLSDLTRFDDARSGDVEIPSPDVDPERFVTAEFGSRVTTGALQWHAAYFHTWIDGLIVRVPIGNDSEYTKMNSGDGYVHGFETTVACTLGAGWSVRGGFTWMEGYSEKDGTDEHIRTMPLTAFGSLKRTSADGRAWIEATVKAVDREDRLTESDKGDTQRIPPGGTPGSVVCHLRAGWKATDSLILGAAVENLFDEDYRTHGSGSNEPGRNYVATAAFAF